MDNFIKSTVDHALDEHRKADKRIKSRIPHQHAQLQELIRRSRYNQGIDGLDQMVEPDADGSFLPEFRPITGEHSVGPSPLSLALFSVSTVYDIYHDTPDLTPVFRLALFDKYHKLNGKNNKMVLFVRENKEGKPFGLSH